MLAILAEGKCGVQGRETPQSASTVLWWLRSLGSREDWAAELPVVTQASWQWGCPCNRTEPDVLCSCGCRVSVSKRPKLTHPNLPLRERFIAADVPPLASLAALSGLGVTAPRGASAWSSHWMSWWSGSLERANVRSGPHSVLECFRVRESWRRCFLVNMNLANLAWCGDVVGGG